MNIVEEQTVEQQYSAWAESHPWLSEPSSVGEEDVDEVIRYTLDEIRFS